MNNELFSEDFLKMKKCCPYTNNQHKFAELMLKGRKTIGDMDTVIKDVFNYINKDKS